MTFGGPFTEEGRKEFLEGWNNPWPELLGLPTWLFNGVLVAAVAIVLTTFVVVPVYTIAKGR